MAHGMAVAHAQRAGIDLVVRSAGTLMIEGAPADSRAIEAAKEVGLDIRSHRSQGVTVELVEWADRILVMEMAHAMHIRLLCSDIGEDKLYLLGGFVGKTNIDDPVGSWFMGPFRTARDEIQTAMNNFFEFWDSTASETDGSQP